MKTKLYLLPLFSLALLPLWAQQPPAPPLAPKAAALQPAKPRDPAKAAELRASLLAKTGGFIPAPVSGPSLWLVDTRAQGDEALLKSCADYLQQLLRFPVEVRLLPGSSDSVSALLSDTNIAAVVALREGRGEAMLLLAPEGRYALVSAAALAADGAAAEVVQGRLSKELRRAVAFLLGAGPATNAKCVMAPVTSLAELDALPIENYSIETLGRVGSAAQRLGLQPRKLTTYRKACEEGWAPAPVNEAQRAIRAEVMGQEGAAREGAADAVTP